MYIYIYILYCINIYKKISILIYICTQYYLCEDTLSVSNKNQLPTFSRQVELCYYPQWLRGRDSPGFNGNPLWKRAETRVFEFEGVGFSSDNVQMDLLFCGLRCR